ncbi:MAG: hypothetical protein WA687_13015 [Solirubrobacterales bacterium]
MDVPVLYKRGQQRLWSRVRTSLLGDGLLERARSTSLALLGLTAAVGLAIVALALNQSWPLIAGSGIPSISPQHQGVGEATIAAGLGTGSDRGEVAGSSARRGPGNGGGSRQRAGGPTPVAAPDSAASAELVVSPSVPAPPQGDRRSGSPTDNGPSNAPHKPQQAPATPAAPPADEPVSSPAATNVTVPTAPAATTSEAPLEADDDPPGNQGNGNGNAYGHDDDWDNHDWDDDEDWDDDHDWDDDDDWDHHDNHWGDHDRW